MEYPLSDVAEQMAKYPQSKPKEVIPDFSAMVAGVMESKLEKIDELSESEIITVIINNTDDIVKDIIIGENKYRKYFTNMRFITIFTRICNNNHPVSSLTRIAVNMIIYDYFTSDNTNHKVKELMMNLAEVVNRDDINRLKAKGFSDNLSKNLVIARNSSMNEEINAARLNFVICNQEPEVMTVTNILYVYEVLYDRIKELFMATMFEAYSYEDKDALGEDFMEVYNNLGSAILIIVDSMTTANINELLTLYNRRWIDSNYKPVRFSLRCLSADYSRIRDCVEVFRFNNIYIP